MFNNLRSRLTLIFIGLAIGPIIVVSLIVARRSFSTLEQEALISQEESARNTSTEITGFLSERENELRLLVQVEGFETLDIEAQRTLLSNLLSYRQVYYQLTLLDRRGQETLRLSRVSSYSQSELVNRSDTEAFQFTTTNQTVFASPVRFDPIAGEPLMTMALPLIDLRSGEISSVLVADFRFQAIWDLIAGIPQQGSEDVFVVDSNGQVIAHRNPSIVLKNTIFDVPTVNGPAKGILGQDVLLARENIQFNNQQFTVIAEQPSAEALELATSTLYVTAVVTVIALLVAIGLVIITVIQVVKPIEYLSATARSIREGDLSARVGLDRKDEIGELARSFNSMTEQLSSLIDNLEDRVKSRTRDLQIAAEVSRQITTVLDLDTLLSQLVERTRQAYELYHVSVFLFHESDASLRLEAATGEAGRQMLHDGKQFTLADTIGLVPKVANTQAPVVVSDVLENRDYFANPMLPNTRSEIALPMTVGTNLIGVLDLQATEANRFQAEDIEVLTNLADQIAIAVRNAELFTAATKAQQEAERANSVKSQFLAAMSHELRTPLNGIINFTGFVADEMMGPVNEQQVKFLKDAIANAEHLLSLINDVLDISKIEAGSLKLFVEDNVDLANELVTVVNTGKAILEDKPVDISLDVRDKLPLIRGDKRRLRQIMFNIVSNACKFTDEGSVSVTAYVDGSEILVTIKDTGPGIDPADHETVFETFLQTEVGLRKGGGTGLGMPISKRLAEAHGGRLWLESQVNKGATFFVALPINSSIIEPAAEV